MASVPCSSFGWFYSLGSALRRAGLLGALTLGLASASQAQTVVISNLAAAVIGGGGGTPSYQLANSFTTGSSAAALESIRLDFGGHSNTGFELSLYSNVDSKPGSSLQILSGPSEPNYGVSTYSAGGYMLSAGTTYWWVATTTGYFSYATSTLGQETVAPGWSIGLAYANANNAGWDPYYNDESLRFEVVTAATPVPEPSTYAALAGGAMLGYAAWRRRRMTAKIAA